VPAEARAIRSAQSCRSQMASRAPAGAIAWRREKSAARPHRGFRSLSR
jgi:hypothetical protein